MDLKEKSTRNDRLNEAVKDKLMRDKEALQAKHDEYQKELKETRETLKNERECRVKEIEKLERFFELEKSVEDKEMRLKKREDQIEELEKAKVKLEELNEGLRDRQRQWDLADSAGRIQRLESELKELKAERDSLRNAELDKNTLAQELGEVKQELGTLETLLKVRNQKG